MNSNYGSDLEWRVDCLGVAEHLDEVFHMLGQVLLQVSDCIKSSHLCISRGHQGGWLWPAQVVQATVDEVHQLHPVPECLQQARTVRISDVQQGIRLKRVDTHQILRNRKGSASADLVPAEDSCQGYACRFQLMNL